MGYDIVLRLKVFIIILIIFASSKSNSLENELDKIYDKQGKIEYYLRCLFISIENQRLEHNENYPAKYLYLIDLEEEALLRNLTNH